MDRIRSTQFSRSRGRAWTGTRRGFVDNKHSDLLYSIAAGCAEFHYDDAEYAGAGHVVDEDATDLLGVVHHGDSVSAFFPCVVGRRTAFAYGSKRRDPFFTPSIWVTGVLQKHQGGSPILWQHLFWFFGHPEVYIAILPGMGLTSQVLATFARKPIFGYRAMAYAILAIGLLGFFVWGHHMFISGMNPATGLVFSLITLTIGVPSAIKTFNWLGTLWGGKIRFTTPMLFAIGFVSLFVSGGLGGIFLGQTSIDLFLHDTYFVVGHFHLIMGVAAIFGMFAGTLFWSPKMFGRMLNEGLGKVHFVLTFVGVYSIFLPMHLLGMAGQPRRYAQFTEIPYLAHLEGLNVFLSIAAIITISAQLIFFVNLFYSMFKGPKASSNPWECTTLEWSVPSPPPFDNFGGVEPVVYHGRLRIWRPWRAE